MQKFAERDAGLLVHLADVLKHAKARESIIAGVSEKLTGELTVLADFLDNVEKRRPKGTFRLWAYLFAYPLWCRESIHVVDGAYVMMEIRRICFYLTILSTQYTHTRYPCHTYII